MSLKSFVPLKRFLMSKMTRNVALSFVMCFQLGTRRVLCFTATSACLAVSVAVSVVVSGVSVLHGCN